jgi:signal peptidase I
MTDDERGGPDPVMSAPGDQPDLPGQQRQSAVLAVPAEPERPDVRGGRRGKPGKARKPRSFWVEFPVLIVIALTIALLVKSFVVQAFFIPSGSMQDTLLVGDKVLVNKLVYDIRAPGRGDIVVFDGGNSWCVANPSVCLGNGPAPGAQSSSPVVRLYDATFGRLLRSIAELFGSPPGQTDFIKRVIGIPGDRVACCTAQGLITVNGVPLHEKSYLYPGTVPSRNPFSEVVPAGRLWVLGDDRGISEDSRFYHRGYPGATVAPGTGNGTIPENMVIGRAFMIVWPASRWQILSVPPTFEQPGLSRALHAAGPGVPLRTGLLLAVPLTLPQRRARLRLPARRPRRACWSRGG